MSRQVFAEVFAELRLNLSSFRASYKAPSVPLAPGHTADPLQYAFFLSALLGIVAWPIKTSLTTWLACITPAI